MLRRAVTFVNLVLICAAVTHAAMEEYDEVPVTRWVEYDGVRMQTPAEIRATWESERPFEITPARPPVVDANTCCIVVNETLYPDIATGLNGSFVPGIEAEGYTVNVYQSSGGEPADLRDFLIARYGEAGDPFTVILIGDLPVAMFEIPGGEHGSSPFPCDLFYMDLDGTWRDDGYNADCYDVHEGEVKADIRFGRLTAGPLDFRGATEAGLLNHYFTKVAAYRAGTLRCRDKALCYVDDDWEAYGPGWGSSVRLAYPDTVVEFDPYTTWDTDYEARLVHDYELIQVCVHSNPVMHQFHRPSARGYTFMDEVYDIKPVALFYNLFACSNALFTYSNYMAGWYTFMDNDYGLAAVGSTKTGSMLYFTDFYEPLSENEPLGEAFRYWFAKWGDASGQNGREWHYGMTLIGDPTLCIRSGYVPVYVRGFTATPAGEAVALNWDYERTLPVEGFNLYRYDEGSPARERVNSGLIAGVPPMHYRDDDVAAGRRYEYELEAVTAGRHEVVASADVSLDGAKPAAFALASPAPNPAASSTTINYAVTSPGAKLDIYDTTGRKLRSFDIAKEGPGSIAWDLADRAGNPLPPGVYIIKLADKSHAAAARVVISRR
ncbi:MAG: T9SS type A sorting domain-containing protein [Candidatus Zixiibacteriota bacterium]|jgi:hypothetical protein